MKTFEEAFKVWEERGTKTLEENVKTGIISHDSPRYEATIRDMTLHLFVVFGFPVMEGEGNKLAVAVPAQEFSRVCGFVDALIQIGVLIGIEMEKPDDKGEGSLQAMWEKDSGPKPAL